MRNSISSRFGVTYRSCLMIFSSAKRTARPAFTRSPLQVARAMRYYSRSRISTSARYLIFGPTRVRAGKPTAWRFLGYIDHAFNKYETSWHRVIAQGNKHWLVIRGQTRSGTGFSSYDDTWYEVSKNNWQPSRQRAGGLWVVSSNSTATRGFALEVAGTISSFRGLTWRRPDEDCEIRWCCLLSLLL